MDLSSPSSNSRLGVPISDDSSEDETSQIRALEEDQGIYHHQEVVVPPQYESDEDRPIKGLTLEAEPPRHSLSAPMERRPSSTKSVRFTGHSLSDDDLSHHKVIDPERLEVIRKLENPHLGDEMEDSDDDVDIPGGTPMPGYPPTSPPAYTPSSPTPPRKVMSPEPPQPNNKDASARSRGSLNGMMSKVAMPFQSMIQRVSSRVDDSDNDSEVYDPSEFTNDEIQVMDMVSDFRADVIELRPALFPFVLDYLPAIGDIDAFIKVPRPDELEDNIGLTQLDEPAVKQSDPTILGMQMRNATKEVTTQEAPIKQLERADQHTEEIDTWIENIKELHRSRPAQTVSYKGPMPDIDRLMQEWHPKFEMKLQGLKLPTADLDVTLEEFADLCLNIVDIPVGKSRIHSLHLLFSLYSEFKNSQHFRSMAQNNANIGFQETTDRLEL